MEKVVFSERSGGKLRFIVVGLLVAVLVCGCLQGRRRDAEYEIIYPKGLPYGPKVLGDHGEIIAGCDNDPRRAFVIWEESKPITELLKPTIAGFGTGASWFPVDVNVHGHVVGMVWANEQSQAFLWRRESGFTLLGDLGGGDSRAHAINDNGIIVGSSMTTAGIRRHAFLWEEGKGMRDLTPKMGDDRDSDAWSVNEAGQVAGRSWIRPFLWTESSGVTTFKIPEHPHAHLFGWVKINDSEQIAGSFRDKGKIHLFLWDAVGGARVIGKVRGDDPYITAPDDSGCFAVTTRFFGMKILGKRVTHDSRKSWLYRPDEGLVQLGPLLPRKINDLHVVDMNSRGNILAIEKVKDPPGAIRINDPTRLLLLRPIRKQEN